MKVLLLLLVVFLGASCASNKVIKTPPSPPLAKPKASAPAPTGVRTREIVKAYPVGRYSHPVNPDTMHERHTLYRQEQAAGWNYQPSQPYALPLGPTTVVSAPSPSYYAQADDEQREAQQKAYAEALFEQNRAMKKRLDALQKNASVIQELQQQVDQLKQQRPPETEPAPEPSSEAVPFDLFSEPQDASSASGLPLPPPTNHHTHHFEISLFPPLINTPDDPQVELFSQMRLQDELSKQLQDLERTFWQSLFSSPLWQHLATISPFVP
jgi:hypothetical protein